MWLTTLFIVSLRHWNTEKIESNMVKIELGCGFQHSTKTQEY